MSRMLGKRELQDIVYGAAFLGSGGGGPLNTALQFVDFLVAQNSNGVKLREIAEIDGEEWGAIAAGIGGKQNQEEPASDVSVSQSISVPTLQLDPEAFCKLATTNRVVSSSPQRSSEDNLKDTIRSLQTIFQRLQTSVGQRFTYTLSGEIGALSVLIPMFLVVFSDNNIALVDADGAGRAVPRLSMTTYASKGISPSPFTFSNIESESTKSIEMVIFTRPNPRENIVVDELARVIVSNSMFDSDSQSLIATYAMSGQTLQDKQPVIVGSITYAQQIGNILRSTHQPLPTLLNFLNTNKQNAFKLFEGAVINVDETNEGGFIFITLTLKNAQNEEVNIYAQNENILIERNDCRRQPLAMAPDLICYLKPDGTPRTNAEPFQKGEELIVIGLIANEKIRKQSIIKDFLEMMKAFDYHGEYIPIENLYTIKRNDN